MTDFINPNDFKSIEITLYVKNTSTGAEVRKAGLARVVELRDRGMLLELPAHACKKGNYLILHFEMQYPGEDKPRKFDTGAKVDQVTGGGDPVQEVTASLLNYDPAAWKSFCAIFSQRQEEIEKFFAAVKGA